MAKKPGPVATSKRDDITVRLDRKLATRARLVAKHAGTSLAEYLTGICFGPVERGYDDLLAEVDRERKSRKG